MTGTEIFAGKILINASLKIYDKYALNLLIDEIYRRLSDIYKDVSYSELSAAKQAFNSAQRSSNYVMEIYGAITHLRSAYNICERLRTGTYKKWSWVMFEKIDEYYIDDYRKRISICQLSAHYAGILYWLYKEINDHNNATEWKKIAIQHFSNYIDSIDYEPEQLQKIDCSYVEMQKEPYTFYWRTEHETRYRNVLGISFKGREFIERTKKNTIRSFVEALDKRISL